MCRVFVGSLGVLERMAGTEILVQLVLLVHLELPVQRDIVGRGEILVPRVHPERLVLKAHLETQAPMGLL